MTDKQIENLTDNLRELHIAAKKFLRTTIVLLILTTSIAVFSVCVAVKAYLLSN